MSVRIKTIAIFGLTFICLVGILYLSSRMQLLSRSSAVEEGQLHDSLFQSRNALYGEVETLNAKASDWAKWGSTATFLRTRDTAQIASLFSETSFLDQRLNLIVLLDPNGRMVYGQGYDLRRRQQRPVSPALTSYLAKHPTLWQFTNARASERGIIMLPEGPLLVAIHPVISRTEQEPIYGTLLIGSYLDRRVLTRLSSQTRFSLAIFPYAEESVPDDIHVARESLSDRRPVFTQPLTSTYVAGYVLINDITGKPALIIRMQRERDTYQLSEHGMHFSLAFFIITGIIFGLVVLLLLEQMVLARIARLNNRMNEIGTQGDLSARVEIPGHDEISNLAMSMNEMLVALEQAQHELRTKEALGESEERYRQLVELSPDAVLIIREGRLAFTNAAGARLLGADSPTALLAASPISHIGAKDRLRIIRQFQRCLTHKEITRLETEILRLDGETVAVELAATPFTYQGKAAIQVIARDITERKRVEAQLHHLAYYDILTGLPNRILSKNRLEHELARARREHTSVAIMLLDLDRFKEVNDSLGHNIGDLVLKTVANRLVECVRESDLVARISGDEFAIIIPDISNTLDAEVTAQRVLQKFVDPILIDAYEVFLTASIGVSIYPDDGDTIETLFKNADLGMYRAKAQGRNSYQFFSPEIGNAIAERRSIGNHLRKAIERHEMKVFYQPQVDLHSRTIVGAEALVRWEHPEMGTVLPDRFIPLAEETGYIVEIDDWVLHTVCEQIKHWERAGLPALRVAVNISAHHFHRQEFIDMLVSVLDETGLSPDLLEMEITETAAMRNIEQTYVILKTINDLGVRIAIDDFGTGYSSLSYLKRFPIHTLKIDRTFVQDILHDADDEAIVDAIIAMAHSLNRKVVAEAVETPEQLDFLYAHQCDTAQGNIFSPPMPADEFQRFLKRWNHHRPIIVMR